ncbi:histidinol-phosphate transaminase [Candidatus Vallotia tarda]|uniref:Histidinol-phosphate aminotransferase n=1 Tax=Candidatus Vallotiella hemipterorum TaxID=1177213 RepID=A0A916JX06_9BURK|nr:histidinol-phosphate transaminase [Candidatus Vallotia tarda]CAG7603318.1 Histidinol-phosphate aminotransferase 1 [Candidatus Vallotia tarda]
MTMPWDVIRTDILAITSYPVPHAEGFIKLDAMENPYALPLPLSDQLGERIAQVALNRYPLPRPRQLLDKLKCVMHIPDDCDVLLGNGSDELINLIATACAKPGAKILAPVPGFVMYSMSAKLAHIEFVGVPLNVDLTLDVGAMLRAIAVYQPAVIYLSYPNNPTGTLFCDSDIERIVRAANRSLIVIDEAYQLFAQRTWISRVSEFDNVVVMRTVSKIGLAGIRLGYLVGLPVWISEFDKVRPPYNINVLTQATVDFMLDHLDVLEMQAAETRAQRARLALEIKALPNFHVFPSSANFLLVRVVDATEVFNALLRAWILIKNVSKMHPLLVECLRITVGTSDENTQLIATLKNTLL